MTVGARSADQERATDRELFDALDPALVEWWRQRFEAETDAGPGYFTAPQRGAIPRVRAGENVLVTAPTGFGKTLSCFAAVIDRLAERSRNGTLDNEVYCLYVSPLRSLANDIERNLSRPLSHVNDTLAEEDPSARPIRQAIRHGDTTRADRRSMLTETPHILNTTPETLAILLNAPKFREKLRAVEYVIVDEIHSLAGDKRGSHLAVSLERLRELARTSPVRVGCSATIEPLDEVASFLVGTDRGGAPRECSIVDCRFRREYDLAVQTPTNAIADRSREQVRNRLYTQLHQAIQEHTTTLVFTNTRAGAERVLHELRGRFDAYDADNSGCHHGSLSAARRQAVETGLKTGDLSVVTSSTSLELGIDMPTVDLVVQLGSPKSVRSLLQRVGRAGHRPGESITGRVFVVDQDELLECTLMADHALGGRLDAIDIPQVPMDVAVQHVYGMAINGVRREQAVRAILTAAYPFRDLTDRQWESLIRYMTGGYEGLEERNVYPKIWRDENDPPSGEHHHAEFPVGEVLIGKRGTQARPIYLTNVGTIPDEFSCDVLTRTSNEWMGSLDGEYLDTLEPGDVFLLGGERLIFRYRRGGKVYVDRTTDRPTVPSWYAERMPLAGEVARARLALQEQLLHAYDAEGTAGLQRVLGRFPIDPETRAAIVRMFLAQREAVGPSGISTPHRLVIEEERDRDGYKRRIYVHACYGRRVTAGLARLVGMVCADRTGAEVRVAVADTGFVLSMPLNRRIDLGGVLSYLASQDTRAALRRALEDSDLLERYFRITATRCFMILKQYKGTRKSPQRRQVATDMLLGYATDLEDFVVIEETYRELLEDKFDVDRISAILKTIAGSDPGVSTVSVERPSPFATGIAELSSSDVVIAGDDNTMENDSDAVDPE